MIHNPEKILFSWAQDEEEGEWRWLLGTYTLQTVSLSGTTNNSFTVVSDKGETYDAPHYRNQLLGSKRNPIAYLRGSKITISAQINLREEIDEGKELAIRLRMADFNGAKEDDNYHTIIMPSEYFEIVEDGKNFVINISDFEIDVKLPNHAYYIEDYEIIFEAMIKEKSVSLDDVEEEWWSRVGESRNDIYVLFDRPAQSLRLLESVLFMTCTNPNVRNANSYPELLNAIWSLFCNEQNNVVDNPQLIYKMRERRRLKYYNPFATEITNAVDLLGNKSGGNGQCGSFAHLFIKMLLAHGYQGAIQYVTYGVDENMKNPDRSDYGFLVHDWQFSEKGTISTFNNINFTHTNIGYGMSTTYHNFEVTEVTDAPGIPGQNSPNPASMFTNHQIVKVGTTYYDPSYGIVHKTTADIEKSIQAVYFKEDTRHNGVLKTHFRIKKYDPNELPLLFD